MFKTMRGWIRGFMTAVLLIFATCFVVYSIDDDIIIRSKKNGTKKFVV